MTLDPDICFRAFESRDRRFEGRFVTAVVTTGIYCRPGCPARMPRRRNLRFFVCGAAAEEAGFRPCLRCRPDSAPGTPAWGGTSASVSRAMRLIDEGALDHAGVDALAERLGVTARHVRRLFAEHVGASPLALARTRRVHFARRLIDETDLSFGEIALGSGFTNVRRFNHAVRETFRRTPGDLRRMRRASAAPRPTERKRAARSSAVSAGAARDFAESVRGAVALSLRARRPFDGRAVLDFLGPRAVPGLEHVERGVYRRGIEIDGARGTVTVRPVLDGLEVAVKLPAPRDLIRVVSRVHRVFDFDADSSAILSHLRRDPALRRALEGRRDLRVPGAWDPFELAVRAILGQQISVRGAATIAGRLVQRLGAPLDRPEGAVTHVFPTAARVANANLTTIGIPHSRAAALRALARAVADGSLAFERLGSLESAVERLTALPGIGEWTAHYIAMRALGEPDAFPAADLGLAHALSDVDAREARLASTGGKATPIASAGARRTSREHERASPGAVLARARAWQPWRAYAVIALWTGPKHPTRRKS
ncbi:MAG: DNA-3-methyladenine glycosylase 2 family protein [Candidatus Eisenbacteria bacterium]|nr:DNA-3-methyladenine glycosylase 2 family protein [Candidatus Eisenbacteria bacterium]